MPRLSGLLGATALLAGLLSAPVGAQDEAASKAFTPAEEEAIQQLVRDYLLEHPEVLIEASQVYRQRQQEIQEQQIRETLVSRRSELIDDPDSPVVGNPDGDVIIVEFFDYRCPYCHRVAESVRETIEDDGNIRMVMKEFPILGPESELAARMALASVQQDKYEELHFALMAVAGKLTEESAFKVAENVGLDLDRLRRDMEAPEIDAVLQRNFALAQALQINGTPAFIIGEEIVRGAIDKRSLRHIIEQTRAKSS